LGPGKAGIRVSADLNWDKTDTTTETYKPAGPKDKNLPTEEQAINESYSRNEPGGATRGVPGFTNPTGTVPNANTKPGQYISTQTGNKYAVDKVVEHRITSPGKIRRISVAVLVDGALPAAQALALKNAFAAGAGLDLEPISKGGRGDKIELISMPFDKTEEKNAAKSADSETKAAAKSEMQRSSFAIGIVALVIIATFFMMRKPKPTGPKLDIIVGDSLSGELDAGVGELTPLPTALLQPEPA